MKRAGIFWFTGLSGAGKTTIANAVAQRLREKGMSVFIIDGDEVRERFHRHLGFSREDIMENNALISRMCTENRARFDVIFVPVISPLAEARDQAKAQLKEGFYEVYCEAGLDYLARQDVKGLYAKAREGIVKDLIGFSEGGVVYEKPAAPDFVVHSEEEDVRTSVERFQDFVMSKLDCCVSGEREK